ncbi:MAG: S-layer homology domain-containing protein [Negativicutes bacterium]
MKKNLIVALALVFVLGIAGTAFAAANPFVDVPAKHWAYDAVTKLAQAGILDGYGDGTYRGERLATRYELAQATAKAMARADKADAQMKALIDKLAVEFAAELNNLGVRVAKLEKNASSIKFWGEARMRYQSGNQGKYDDSSSNGSRFQQRMRIYAKADLNEKATFYGRMAAEWTDRPDVNSTTNSEIFWDYGYFQWTFNPSFKVSVGRHQVIGAQDMFWTNGGYDGIQFYFGAPADRFSAKFGYGDVGNYANAPGVKTGISKELALLDVNYKLSDKFSLNGAMYWGIDGDRADFPYQVWSLGFTSQLSNDFKLKGAYFHNASRWAKDTNELYGDSSPNGWYGELWYKGAQKTVVGTWGLSVNYRDAKPYALDWSNVSGVFGNSMTTGNSALGIKGWGFQANYTVSKNAVLTATYETLNRNNSDDHSKLKPFYYLQMNVYF